LTVRPYRLFFLFFILITAFFLISLSSADYALLNNDRIAYGVESNGIVLSGLSKQDAQAKLAALYQEKRKSPILQLHHEGKMWEISASDIDLQADSAKTAGAAYEIGRTNSLLVSSWQILYAACQGKSIDPVITYDESKLQKALAQIAQNVNQPSANAYCELTKDNQILVMPEKIGKRFDYASWSQKIAPALHKLDFPQIAELPIEEAVPAIKSSDLQSIDTILGSYSTHFDPGEYNRSQNIRIGAESLNHVLLAPEKILSFNDTVGHRVSAAGYKDAPVLVDGEVVPGIGGGICQVSSTLYNAILLADLKPTERDDHFYPSSYVPIGFDATVADDLIDFKFQNTMKKNIYLLTAVYGDTITIYILGSKSDRPNYEIRLISATDKILSPQTITRYSNELPRGTQRLEANGRQGYMISAYRVRMQNGQEIGRELLHQDEYSAKDRVMVIGTK
jgi:Uncharacterized vancomycin resistance protein